MNAPFVPLLEQYKQSQVQMMPGSPMNRVQQAQKNDPSGTPVGPYNHGPDGIFFLPYSNNRLVSTLVMPRGGLMDVLPVLDSDPYEAPQGNLFGSRQFDFDTIMTGVTQGDIESFSNQPTTDCADGPVGGMVKLCTQVNTLARYRGGTDEVSMWRAGLSSNRLDTMAHTLLNQAESLQAFFGMPDSLPPENSIIMNEMARRLWTTLVSFRRFFAQRIWIGSPSNNNGEARDILGLQTQINTGKRDAFTGNLCAAADSIVMNFNLQPVEGGGTVDIVEYLETAEYTNTINAERMGLGPIDGVLVMRESLFYQLTNVMPVKQYQEVIAALAVQAGGDRTRMMINATDAANARNQMRNSKMIPINGKMYRVILDDGIPELTNVDTPGIPAGSFASDIYFIPLTVMGGMPATFFQYYNHNNQQAQGILQGIPGNDAFTFTSDGGSFRWFINFRNGCVKFNFDFSPWLKVKMPQVAWRISNVLYTPTLHARDFNPASSYFANGGNVGFSGQPELSVYYPPWSETAENL